MFTEVNDLRKRMVEQAVTLKELLELAEADRAKAAAREEAAKAGQKTKETQSRAADGQGAEKGDNVEKPPQDEYPMRWIKERRINEKARAGNCNACPQDLARH